MAAGNSGPPSGGAEGTEQRSAAENSEPPNGGDAERAPGPATPEGASGRVRGARRPPPGGPAPTPPPTPLSTPALRTAHRRTAHPVAWWGWALLLATAAGRTANPCLLLLIVAVAGLVVAYCRGSEPWSGAYRVFLAIGLTAVAVRFAFYLVFGGADGPTVLFTLPAATLPDWAAGFRLGGAVTAEGALAAAYDGLRLATLLVCVGAANALASPRRLLRSVPAALYEVSVAVVVALSVAPQLVASVGRVRRARALRGNTRRDPADLMRTVVAPVLHDALDRSLALAAAMASRGYGRAAGVPPAARRATGAALLVGLTGLCAGAYALLGAATPAPLAWGVLAAGAGAAVFGIAYASKRVPHTRYRPDRFTGRDWAVLASGAAALAGTVLSGLTEPAALWPATNPLAVPALPLQAAAGVLLAAAPALLVPATPKGTP
ncbi:energy-coupling factor transporter transmembrane protein EcfT [Glycomyces paridis]|uniref:Energy-coupling factor transporter transmembrane protein EcfT n=1 Tax=Glycomyces paridis TaxID=2126555 RepID=A0A4S8PCA1_9ACTN|nr:energy-coupling factor transporter transmembrane protein EcfT [Glycomyces paridis]